MSTNGPRIFIMIFSDICGMSVWTNAFGTSNVITSRRCFASITPVIMIASVAAVGLAASSFGVYGLCVLPLAHVRAFTVPSLFSDKKIKLSIARLLSLSVSLLNLMGNHTLRSCNCFISLNAAFSPRSPNFFNPDFRL